MQALLERSTRFVGLAQEAVEHAAQSQCMRTLLLVAVFGQQSQRSPAHGVGNLRRSPLEHRPRETPERLDGTVVICVRPLQDYAPPVVLLRLLPPAGQQVSLAEPLADLRHALAVRYRIVQRERFPRLLARVVEITLPRRRDRQFKVTRGHPALILIRRGRVERVAKRVSRLLGAAETPVGFSKARM